MKLLYKPFAVLSGVIGARLGQRIFKAIWGRIDESEPPAPTESDTSMAKVVGAAALQAAALAGSKAAVSRASARSFHYLTGVWPGRSKADPSAQIRD
jgi:hypothetical protein